MRNEGNDKSLSRFRIALYDASEKIRAYARRIDLMCEELVSFKDPVNDLKTTFPEDDYQHLLCFELRIAELQAKIDDYQFWLDGWEAAGKDMSMERYLLASCEEALSTIYKDKEGMQLARRFENF